MPEVTKCNAERGTFPLIFREGMSLLTEVLGVMDPYALIRQVIALEAEETKVTRTVDAISISQPYGKCSITGRTFFFGMGLSSSLLFASNKFLLQIFVANTNIIT